MSRSTLRPALGLLLSLVALVPVSLAAEKTSPTTSGDSRARDAVVAALEAEVKGDNSERSRQLADALKISPDSMEANWQTAHIKQGDTWLPVAQAMSLAAKNSDLAQYREMRSRANKTPKALRELARWCERSGWKDVAQLHYAQLLSHPQSNADIQQEAVKKLNLASVNGAWLSKQEVEERQRHQQTIQSSLTKWRPRLHKLALLIGGHDFPARDKAIQELHAIDDPQIIPALASFVADGGDTFQEESIKRLATFPHYEATEALAYYSVL
jgi:hypothetical protein